MLSLFTLLQWIGKVGDRSPRNCQSPWMENEIWIQDLSELHEHLVVLLCLTKRVGSMYKGIRSIVDPSLLDEALCGFQVELTYLVIDALLRAVETQNRHYNCLTGVIY